MCDIFEHIMQVPSPGNNEVLGKLSETLFLLKSQDPHFSSQSPAATAALCSVVCSEPGARYVPQLGTGLWEFLSLGGLGSVPDIPEMPWESSSQQGGSCRTGWLFQLTEALLAVSDCFNRCFLHFGGPVPIVGMGLAGEFEGGEYTASFPVNCWNIFCFCSDFSTTLWVKSKPLSNQWGFSHGFKEADLLCEDKLELHFAKLHVTKMHCSFTAALIINTSHFTLFWVTPLRF